MNDKLNFDEHKSNMFKAISGMRKALEPLNDKLKPLNAMIYIDSGMTWLNTHRADDRSGFSIHIDNDGIEKMISMTNDQLKKELRD